MHPEHAVIRGELPGWNVRCFAEQKVPDAENSYQEVPMNLDTIWFIPEFMRGVMVWHGVIEVADEFASDLLVLQIEDEQLYDKPKSINDYRQRFLDKTKRESLVERKQKQAQEIEKKKKEVIAKAMKNLPNSKIFNDPGIQEALAKAQAVNQQIIQEANQGLVATKQAPINATMPKLDPQSLLAHMLAKVDQPVVSEKEIAELNPIFQMAGLGSYNKSDSLNNNITALFKNSKILKAGMFANSKAEIEKSGQTVESVLAKKPPKIDMMVMRQELKKIYDAAKSNDPNMDEKLAEQLSAKGLPNLNSDFEAFLAKQKFPTLFSRADLEEAYAKGESLHGERFYNVDLSGIDLSGANLQGTYFLDCNMQYANLSHANLSQANFSHTDLTNTNFEYANCFNAIFQHATLDNANFQHADLSTCELSHTTARNTDFSHADLVSSKISYADWEYACLKNAKASGAIIRYSQLTHANLCDIDLSKTNIISCKFEDAALQRAKLRGALVKDVHFVSLALAEIDLEQALFMGLVLENLNFSNANLNKAKFMSSQFKHVEFSNSQMEKFSLSECHLQKVQFYNCTLKNFQAKKDTKIEEANFKMCDLQKSNWGGAKLTKLAFYRCNLTKAIFDGAEFDANEFSYCQAAHARFFNANLGESKFYWTSLTEAVMRNATIAYTTFSHCNLYKVDFFHTHTDQTVIDACLLQNPLPQNFEDNFIHG
jgi:uncharacterized protein YjbI with pentapeptide repeats